MPPPPQQPYGQQPAAPYGAPYGQPYPAAWSPPPPLPKSRVGLVLGIVGGVVALLIVVVAGIVIVGVTAQTGFPEAEYELTLPATLLDGEYELSQDFSDSSGRDLEEQAEGAWDARDVRATVATYAPAGQESAGRLAVSGMYGRFKNTAEARDRMMKGAAAADGVTVAVPPEDFQPSGADTTVTCQVLAKKDLTGEIVLPVCGWNDGNTGAVIEETTLSSLGQDPDEVDLEAFAERTARVRAEMRRPID